MLSRYRFKDYKSHNGALVCVTRLESECVIDLGGQFPASEHFLSRKSSTDLFKSKKFNKNSCTKPQRGLIQVCHNWTICITGLNLKAYLSLLQYPLQCGSS